MREEDSIRILVDWFQQKCPGNLNHYGYDVFLPSLIRWHHRSQRNQYNGNEEDKYLETVWRDEAAHGKPSGIGDNEAYTSLAMMLRYALFINSRWDQLMAGVQPDSADRQ